MNNLARLATGQSASIAACCGDPVLAQRLMSMGIMPGQQVHRRQQAPLAGPIKVHSDSTVIALRLKDAALVEVQADGI